MNRRLQHYLAVLLAVSTMAAQAICVCPVEASDAQPVQPQAKDACHGSGKCCVKDAPTAPVPAKSEQPTPCEHCNVIHPADRIQPDRQDVPVTVHQPFLALAPVPALHAAVSLRSFATRSDVEHVPIPPLLQDLFHSGILLLV